jgi:ribose/xylose/arabinose/galactoside ABC-type transport system permease subunit
VISSEHLRRLLKLRQVSRKRLAVFTVTYLIWFIDLGLILFFGALNFSYFNPATLIIILYSVSALGFLIYAEGIAMISGQLDLSVGAIAAFASVIVGKLAVQWAPQIPPVLLLPLYLVIGGFLGFVNGYAIGKLKINSFLMTLSVYLALYGLNVVIAPGTISRIPDAILAAGAATVLGTSLPLALPILVLGAIAMHIVLAKTRFGRQIYAIGGSQEASRACGIDVGKAIIATFVVVGLLSGIAGLIYTGYQSVVTPYLARDDVFNAFTGPIIGGVALTGGRGKMIGIFGGITLLGIIDIGLTTLGYPVSWRTAVHGVILGIAIVINTARERMRSNLLARPD